MRPSKQEEQSLVVSTLLDVASTVHTYVLPVGFFSVRVDKLAIHTHLIDFSKGHSVAGMSMFLCVQTYLYKSVSRSVHRCVKTADQRLSTVVTLVLTQSFQLSLDLGQTVEDWLQVR